MIQTSFQNEFSLQRSQCCLQIPTKDMKQDLIKIQKKAKAKAGTGLPPKKSEVLSLQSDHIY